MEAQGGVMALPIRSLHRREPTTYFLSPAQARYNNIYTIPTPLNRYLPIHCRLWTVDQSITALI